MPMLHTVGEESECLYLVFGNSISMGALSKKALRWLSARRLVPIALLALSGGRPDFSVVTAVPAACLAALGWLAGLWPTDHPLLHELMRVIKRFSRDGLHLPKVKAPERTGLYQTS